MMKKHPASVGFTLIEVIVAVALLGLIAVALLSMISFGQTSIFRGGHRSEGNYQLQQVAETILQSDSFAPYAATNPKASPAAATLTIVFPSVGSGTTIAVPGNEVEITYTSSTIEGSVTVFVAD